MRQVKIGLIGMGTVGGGVIRIIKAHHDDILRHQGVDIQLAMCSSLDRNQAVEFGVEDIFVDDANKVIENPDIDIVIELIGGTGVAKTFVLNALNAGKHVVTANKALMASSGEEIFDAAEKNGVSILFGASVGGGIPIIGPLKHSLDANEISSVIGIVNGTTNYMLTKMTEDGSDYTTVLREAQRNGFAEANPSADVDGFDAAAKIAILASIAFNSRVTIDQVPTEGITKIMPIDLQFAAEMGYKIKLLAIAKRKPNGIEVRVHPAMIPTSHPLASVDGVYNAIYVVGDFVGNTMFYGEGAGSGAAASAVMGDVLETAKLLTDGIDVFRGCTCTDSLPVIPISELTAQYYIRIPVKDRTGVIAAISKILADRGISIKSVMQRGGDGKTTDLMVITHESHEDAVQGAIADMMETEVLVSEPQIIRLVD
ncbi:MAG: homoserine dehydrogenase [Coriobacteriales bacterium]|jgi:homoserine dehydrogenase